ncbi:Ig-like domain-containing protein [Comamonas sp. C11]|uniref:Ig-like domain-containing protein n=1 Tax=Comamonas sp. C11 TaxID=2966554 RepID=UPI002111E3FE|nr:Ig-like domain-containing protein [Comamonas sp. C11]UUC95406.1 Ig-like domain-containing protein [Comamonas sp. C11]
MEAVYKSGGKVASTEQGLVLDKPSAVILKVAPEQIAKSTRVGNDLVLTLVDGKQIHVSGFFAVYPEEGRNDLVLEDQQGVLWWGQYGGAWEGFEFTEIESNESVAAWLPWLVGLGLGGLAVSSGGSGGSGKNANNPPEPVDPNEGLSPGALGHVPGQEFNNGGYKVTVREDQPFNGKVVGKDSDGDSLTYGLGTPPAHGTVTIDKDTGEYTYTPNKDWSGPGTDRFEVIVDDGKGGKTTTTVTVNVGAEQDAFDDIEGTGFGKPVTIDVLANDEFAGDNVRITQVDGKAITEGGAAVALTDGSGRVKLVGGKLEFTPKAGFVGDAHFEYTAQTDGGTPETANVTVTVAANQLPEPTDPNIDPNNPEFPGQTFTPGPNGGYKITVDEDQPFNGKITGTDKDGDALEYTQGTGPSHGTVTIDKDTGEYTYTPDPDYNGPDEFTVIVDDGKGGKTTTTVTVEFQSEVDVTADTATTGYEKSVTINVLANDEFEGANPTITKVDNKAIVEGGTVTVANGEVRLVGGKLVFTPADGFHGNAEFSYTAKTDKGSEETANVTVTVAANQLPEPTDPNEGLDPSDPDYIPGQTFTPGGGYTVTVGEDQPFNGKITGTDKDGDALEYTQGTGPSHGTVTIDKDTGEYTYTPDPDYNGPDEFTVIVDDGKGGKTTTTVTVEFQSEVDVTADTATTGYEKSVTINVLANDEFEGANPTITKVDNKAIVEGGAVTVANGEVRLVGGKLVFTPADGFHGNAEFSYTAKTDKGSEETANVTVTVAANQLPEPTDPNEGLDPSDPDYIPGQTFTPGPGGGYIVTVGEDQPFNGKVTGTDKDGDTLTYELGDPPAHGTVTVTPDGKYTYTPHKDWSGPGTDRFEVIVDDGKGGKTTTTVTVNVTPEQDVSDDTASTGYEKSVTIDVLANDEFEGDNVRITQVDGKAITEGGAAVALSDGSGSVKLVGGQLEFTPKAGFVGDAHFEYTAQTDGGTPETANVAVTVAANQLPEPTDPNIDPNNPEFPGQTFTPGPNGGYKITVDEDQPFNGKVTGTDKDGDALEYTQGTGPSHGTVTIDKDTGEYTYTPDPDYNGPDEFTVIVDDGKGGKTTTTVTVEFQSEVDVTADTATTGYEKSVTINVLANDEFEGANPTITKVDNKAIVEGGTVTVANGEVRLVGGKLVFTPADGFHGNAEFSYTAKTDKGSEETANVAVTVAANQLPEPTDPNIDPNNPEFPGQTFTPGPNGGYKITVDEDQPFNGKVTGTDKDGDTLEYTQGTGPSHGTVTIDKDTGEYTYTPDPDYNGPDEFTVIVDDGKGGKTTTTVTVEFQSEVDVTADTATTGYEKSVTINVLANDEFEGANPTITKVDNKAIVEGGTVTVANGEVRLVGGKLVFTPADGFHGNAEFSYTAKTDKGSEETANVTVTVAANQLPEPTDPNIDPNNPEFPGQTFTPGPDGGYKITVDEDQPFNGKITGTDKDGDTLEYTQGTGPSHGTVTIDKDTGEYTYTPDPDYNGPDEFTVIVDDGKGGKTTTTVTVEFQSEVDVTADTATTGYEKSVTINVLANDEFEGANVTITQVDGKAITEGGAAVALTDGSGSVKLVSGKLEFTPKAGFVGDAHFEYTAQTDGGTPEQAGVTVTVAANQLPEPTDPNEGLDPSDPDYIPGQTFTPGPGGGYTVTVGEDQPFNGKVTGTDKDGDTLTYELGDPPAHGTVTVTPDGKYTYTPHKDWSGPGTDRFEVIVDDGKGGKTTTTVTVNVTPEQDVSDDTASTGYEKSVTINVLANDEFEGANPTITKVDNKAIVEGGAVTVANGEVRLVGGKLVFTPADGFHGNAEFSYTAKTDKGSEETANVTVTVAANQLPEPTDPNIDPNNPEFPGQTFTPGPNGGYKITVDEDQPFNGKITGTDKDGDTLEYTQGTGPSHGTVTIDKDTGEYTYTPDPDYNGPDEFTVIVDDGKGGKTTTTVTVEFTPEQDVTDDTATTGYDKPVTIDVLGNDDFEGANVTITQVDGKAITEGGAAVALTDGSGSVKLVGGQLEFTPKAGFVGDAHFEYTAQTDGGTPEQAGVTVTVAANQLPEPTDPNEGLDPSDPDYIPGQSFTPGPGGGYTVTVGEDQPFNGKITGTDKDGDTLEYTKGTGPSHGTVTIDKDTGEYTYTPDPDYNGPDEFTVIVDDGKGGKTTTTVTVEFTPEQDVTDDTATTGYDKPVTIDVLGNDEFEGANVTITQVDGKAITEGGAAVALTDGSGSVKLVGGQLEFTPKAGFVGDAHFEYTAQTDGGTPEQAGVTVTVAANQLPEPTDPNEGLDPSDPDYIPGQTFTPGPGGGYTVTVGEDQPFNGKVTGTDKDGDTLTYELGDPPAHGTVTVTPDGKYTYTPHKDWSGPGTDRFEVIVDDGKGGKTTTTVKVNVTPEQDVSDDTASTGYEKSVTIDVLANDEFEGDNVRITQVDGKAITEGGAAVALSDGSGSVKLVGGQLEFTPKAGFVGDAHFEYTAQTDGGTPEQAGVTVTVSKPPVFVDPGDPGEPPVTDYTFSYDENSPVGMVLGQVKAIDTDSISLTYSIDPASDPNGWYAIDPLTGEITLTAAGAASDANDFEKGSNSQQIKVVATDTEGGKTEVTVTLQEKDLNDTAPVVEIAPEDKVLHVAEEALPGGIKDDLSSTTTATGKITFTDADKTPGINTFSVEMEGPVDGSVKSGGVDVTWHWDASTSTLTGMAGAKEVMTVKVGALSEVGGKYEASYTVTLKGPLDHAASSGENTLDLAFKAIVHDGEHDSEIGFAVEVKDDVPTLSDDAELAINLSKLQTNLMIVLDLSGSMNFVGGGNQQFPNDPNNRLNLAKKALEDLINKYDEYGDVAVKLVTFGDVARTKAYVTWMSALDAIATIKALTANGGTSYKDALDKVMGTGGFTDDSGKLTGEGVQNVSYFVTDGVPAQGPVSETQQATWEAFVKEHHINSVGVGFGGILEKDIPNIDPIAYNGAEGKESTVVVAASAEELNSTLQNLIQLPRQEGSLRGELDSTVEGFGADGGFVNVLNVDGKTYTYLPGQDLQVTGGAVEGVDYTYDAVKHIITVKTAAGGSLTVEFDTAKFIYEGKALSSYWDKFGYTIQDMDGDTASTVKDVKVVYDGVDPGPKPTPFASPMMAMSLDLEHLDALHTDADEPAALPALQDVLQSRSEAGEAAGNIAGLGSADTPAAPTAPAIAPQDLALYMPAPLPEEELQQPVHV